MTTTNRKRKATFPSDGSAVKRPKLAEGLLDDPKLFNPIFQPGQITRIYLLNWMSFDQAEIKCEPGLNLIIGPNGTGKSAVVSAICLGLAGKPKSLGRGDKASQFIKHGRNNAKIEIELFAKGRPNDIILRIIKKNSSEWLLNNKRTSAKKIQEFVKKKRNIKVDNLCQFLAQDRVSAFAGLSPKELLIETEKTIENNDLYTMHQFLIENGENADQNEKEIDNLKKILNQNIAEKESLVKTVEQLKKKQQMEKEMINYKALMTWNNITNKYRQYKRQQRKTVKLKNDFENKKSDIRPMQKQVALLDKKLQTAKQKYNNQTKKLRTVDKRRMDADEKLKDAQVKIEEYEDEIAQAKEDYKMEIRQIKKKEAEIEKAENALADFDEEEIENTKQQKKKVLQQLQNLRPERNKLTDKLRRMNGKTSTIENNLEGVKNKLDTMKNVSKDKEKHIFNARRQNEKQFKTWVDRNLHEFKGEVYGPIVNEMSVATDIYANYLNNYISPNTFYGYVCTNSEDWAVLLRQQRSINLQCTIFLFKDNNRNTRRPVSHSLLHDNGVNGYLDELFDAPDIIKKTVNLIHGLDRIAYCMEHIRDSRQLDNVLMTRKGQTGLTALVTPSSKYNVKVSHYTDNVMRGQNAIKNYVGWGILKTTRDRSAEIIQKEQEQKELEMQLNNIIEQKKQVEFDKKNVRNEITKLQTKKSKLEDTIKDFNKIKNTLNKKKKDLEKLESEQCDPKQVEIKFTLSIQKTNNERVKIFAKLANVIELETNLLKQSNVYQITKKYYFEELKFANNKMRKIERQNETLKTELNDSKKMETKLNRQYTIAIQNGCEHYPRAIYGEFVKNKENKLLSIDAIENKIDHLQGRISAFGIDLERVERYKRLMHQIEQQQTKLQLLCDEQSKKNNDIKDIENRWKPKLLEAVDKISLKFSEFFAQFNKAKGKVKLVFEDEKTKEQLKYSEWHVDILTKFRLDDNTPWKRLTSSSQSGGEKSVSTMLYLLSLQQVTTVPFRVVDEINQGMDRINERRIMKILNYECTPNKNRNRNNGYYLPQYFVVTPKLLPDLKYSPCSSVYVIFNGPWQMADQQWQMDQFIQSQKELTGNLINNVCNESDDEDEDEEESTDESN